MKTSLVGLLVLAFVCSVTTAYAVDQDSARLAGERIAIASRFVDLLREGRFPEATTLFDPDQMKDYPADTLAKFWGIFMYRSGGMRKLMSTEVVDSNRKVEFLWICKRENWRLRIGFTDTSNGIDVFLIKKETGSDQGVKYRTPRYVVTDSVVEREVTFGKDPWKLPGAINMPMQPGSYPAVVLVHPSGPLDKDATHSGSKPFADLAWGLASRGFVVMRYEKRTRHYVKSLKDTNLALTPEFEVVDDAREAIRYLRTRKYVNPKKIFVLGMGLGGYLLPRITKPMADSIAGMIIVSATSRPQEETILENVRYTLSLDSIYSSEEKQQIIAKLERQVARLNSPTFTILTPASELPLEVPASYWISLKGYSPSLEASKLRAPLLVLQGGRDFQTTQADWDLWQKHNAKRATGPATFQWFENLNFLMVHGNGKSSPWEYRVNPGNVDEEVIDILQRWMIDNGK